MARHAALRDAPMALAALAAECRARGFDLVSMPLPLHCANALADLPVPSRIPGPAGAACVVVGNSGPPLWESFLEACSLEAGLADLPDPLDTYVERELSAAVAAAGAGGGGLGAAVYYAHRPLPAGGFSALQRVAAAARLVAFDPSSHLCVHHVHGPWVSLRAAVVLPGVDAAPPSGEPEAADVSPEASKAAADALARATKSARWEDWVAVRDAVAGGPRHPSRFSEAQIRFHYAGDRSALK